MPWLLLLSALAGAQAPPDPPPRTDHLAAEAPDPSAPIGVAEAGSYDVLDVLDQAAERRQAGDLAGARALLAEAEPHVTAAQRHQFLYQRGILAELSWDFGSARADYEEAIRLCDADPGLAAGATAADARFRLALVLEDLGDPEGALTLVRAVAHMRGLTEDDTATLALQEAISRVNVAKPASGRARRATGRLLDELAAADGGGAGTWLRAKGRYTVAHALFAEAAARPMTGSQRRVVKALEERVRYITSAEKEIVTLVGLAEPEWILRALLDLGDAWSALADALDAAPPPPELDAAELATYRQALAGKATNVRRRAWESYDQGVQLAARLGFESPWVGRLAERRAATAARLGGG